MSAKTVFASQLTEVTTAAKDVLGDLRYEQARTYKYIQYRATAIAGVAGRMMGFFTLDGMRDHLVTQDTSDQVGILKGAGVLQAAMVDTEFGWVQVSGPATLTDASVAGVDGDPMTLTGATADTGDLDVNVATAANTHICAWAGDISDDEYFLTCLH